MMIQLLGMDSSCRTLRQLMASLYAAPAASCPRSASSNAASETKRQQNPEVRQQQQHRVKPRQASQARPSTLQKISDDSSLFMQVTAASCWLLHCGDRQCVHCIWAQFFTLQLLLIPTTAPASRLKQPHLPVVAPAP
jgi:hypothetical protein